MGIDKSVLDKGFNKYSSYLSKIPGMNSTMAKPIIDMIKGSMNGDSQPQPKQKQRISFDKNRYPKINQ